MQDLILISWRNITEEKLDAPSGTAIALAEAVNEPLNNEYEFVYDRSQRREQRPKKRDWNLSSPWWNDRWGTWRSFLQDRMKLLS